MNVDVATGWAGTPPVALTAALAGLPELATDTGAFGRSADWSTIYNLPVTSFQIAATNLNVFFGDGFDWTDADADDVIDLGELGSTTKGFLLSGGDIGFLLLSGGKTGVAAFDAARQAALLCAQRGDRQPRPRQHRRVRAAGARRSASRSTRASSGTRVRRPERPRR